jgi:hypothetical protein
VAELQIKLDHVGDVCRRADLETSGTPGAGAAVQGRDREGPRASDFLLAVDLLAGPVAGEVDLIEESRAGRPVDLRERRADGARTERVVSDWRPSHAKSRRPRERRASSWSDAEGSPGRSKTRPA